MNNKFFTSLFALVLVVLAGLSSQRAEAKGGYYFGFEQTTKPFVAQATQNMSTSLDRVIGDSNCSPSLNNHYARLASKPAVHVPPGRPDATWIVAKFPSTVGYEADRVTVSWSARVDPGRDGKGNCVDCLSIAYAGNVAPQAETFTTLPAAGGAYMSTGWANYKFNAIVVPEVGNSIYVAMGWNGTGSAIDLDCLTITIVPILTGR